MEPARRSLACPQHTFYHFSSIPTAPVYLPSFCFLKCIDPIPASGAFALAISSVWNFPPPDSSFSRSFENVSAYVFLSHPPDLIGSPATPHQSPFLVLPCVSFYLCTVTETQAPPARKLGLLFPQHVNSLWHVGGTQ